MFNITDNTSTSLFFVFSMIFSVLTVILHYFYIFSEISNIENNKYWKNMPHKKNLNLFSSTELPKVISKIPINPILIDKSDIINAKNAIDI